MLIHEGTKYQLLLFVHVNLIILVRRIMRTVIIGNGYDLSSFNVLTNSAVP